MPAGTSNASVPRCFGSYGETDQNLGREELILGVDRQHRDKNALADGSKKAGA